MTEYNEEEYNGEEVEEVKGAAFNDLSYFMPDKQKKSPIIEVHLSKRFVDKDGDHIPFKMRAITVELMEKLEKDSKTPVNRKDRRAGKEETLDTKRFYEKVALHTTVYPDFTSKELLDAYGEVDPIHVAKAILNVPGEYANWVDNALRVNELDEDYSDLEDEVKK